MKGLLVDTRLLIEPKIDGCAVALQYRDGTLEKAISRKGTDVTSKLINVQDIPNNLPLRGVLQVRGCLLYTSDAADDMQCVDLGGRRIIKKGFNRWIFERIINRYQIIN